MTNDVKKTYDAFLERWHDVAALSQAGECLNWDQETMIPSLGATARAEQLAVIEKMTHELFVADELWQRLEELQQALTEGMLSQEESANVRLAYRDVSRARKIPTKLAEDMARHESRAVEVWKKARVANDFTMFLPELKKTFAFKREYAKLLAKDQNDLYTGLLQDYEPDFTTSEVRVLFAEFEKELTPLIAKVLSLPKPDHSMLSGKYEDVRLVEFATAVARYMGLQLGVNCRLDQSAHPFCSGTMDDVRLTMRTTDGLTAYNGVLHEGGHAFYEQGLPCKHAFQPIGRSVSLGVHESQSRLWEVVIGGSRAFQQFLFPKLQKKFPEALSHETAESFYRAINVAQATPIRVEADPLTYNAHIFLRFGIEQAIINGELEVDGDLPKEWNRRFKELLGFTPKDDAEGILQDTHWASGLVGYFPTYTLGNMISAQIHEAITEDLPNWDGMIAVGNFSPTLEWLRKNIHLHGSLYDAKTLVERATRKPIGHNALIRFFKKRYGDVYGVTL